MQISLLVHSVKCYMVIYARIIAYFKKVHNANRRTSGGVVANKLDKQIISSQFESHWVEHSSGLVSHLNKKAEYITS